MHAQHRDDAGTQASKCMVLHRGHETGSHGGRWRATHDRRCRKGAGRFCDMQSLGLANGTQRSGRGAGDWRESERSLHHQCPKEAIDKIRWGCEGESATRCHQRRRRRATVSVASHSATNNVAEVCRVFCDASSAPAVVLITLAPCIVAYRKEIRSR